MWDVFSRRLNAPRETPETSVHGTTEQNELYETTE